MTASEQALCRRRVKRVAARYATARADLEAAIRDGRDAGLSLRDLGEASGLSAEWVRKLLAREEAA